MKLLYIAPYLPYPPNSGSVTRTFNLIKNLVVHNEIYLIALIGEDRQAFISKMNQYCNEIQTVELRERNKPHSMFDKLQDLLFNPPYLMSSFYNEKIIDLAKQIVRREEIDIIQIELLHMSYCLDYIHGIPVVLDEHNIEWYRLMRQLRIKNLSLKHKIIGGIDNLKLQKYEIDKCKKVDRVLVTSEVDKAIIGSNISPHKICVIENGVDIGYFQPQSQEVETNSLIFAGSMFYEPNIDAMIYFYNKVFPLIENKVPDIKLYIVGQKPPKEIELMGLNSNVIVTGFVEDVRPWLTKCAVYICPIRAGGGTRLKLLDAMAMGKAIVCTNLSCEGLSITNGKDALIADTPQDFADKIIELLKDSKLRRELGHNARKLVEEKYSWEKIIPKLNEVYFELL